MELRACISLPFGFAPKSSLRVGHFDVALARWATDSDSCQLHMPRRVRRTLITGTVKCRSLSARSSMNREGSALLSRIRSHPQARARPRGTSAPRRSVERLVYRPLTAWIEACADGGGVE